MQVIKQKQLRVLFIGKADDSFSRQAADFVITHYPTAKIVFSTRQQPFPQELLQWQGDIIISYLSQWIIPKKLLESTKIAAINFHPGPPEYPGIGCTNFAVYNNEHQFGITCHHMAPNVDTGDIIAVTRFDIYETDTVFSITQRCYSDILNMFYEIFSMLMKGGPLPLSNEKWTRKPFIRKQLDELCRLTPEMDVIEIERRIKATNFLGPWAYMQIGEQVKKLTEDDIRSKKYLAFLSQADMS